MNNQLAKMYSDKVNHDLIRWAQRNKNNINLAESYEIVNWYKNQYNTGNG